MGISKQLSLFFPFLNRGQGHAQHPTAKGPNLRFRGKATRSVTRHRASPETQKLLESTWFRLRWVFFPDRSDLDLYTLEWSSRQQKRVLASCNIRQKRVRVARELLEPSAARWIEAVVYHEMCHAVLGFDVSRAGGRRQWHGKEFRALELQHPDSVALDHWIRSGGWHRAVRSNRARTAWEKRRIVL